MGEKGKKYKKGENEKRVKNARRIPQNWGEKKISPDRGWEKNDFDAICMYTPV